MKRLRPGPHSSRGQGPDPSPTPYVHTLLCFGSIFYSANSGGWVLFCLWEWIRTSDGWYHRPGCFHLVLCVTAFRLCSAVQHYPMFAGFHCVMSYEGYGIMTWSHLKAHVSKARHKAHFSVTTSNRCLWLVSCAKPSSGCSFPNKGSFSHMLSAKCRVSERDDGLVETKKWVVSLERARETYPEMGFG